MIIAKHDPTHAPHTDPDDPASYLQAPKRKPLPLPTLDDEGRVLYFAYGSNLDIDQMEDRCPGAELVYAATMDGYQIIFTGHSRRRSGGVATIVKRKDATVEGLVFSLTADDVRALDACEGAPFVYRRIEFEMQEDDRVRPCITYMHRDTDMVAPSHVYYRQIRRAYEDNNFNVAPLHKAVECFAPRRRSKRSKAPDMNADMITDTHRHLVFVYGTLLHGCGNHSLLDCDGAEFVGEDSTRDEFHMVDTGWFPGILRGGCTAVTGEVYRVDDSTMLALDRLEGVPTLYTRQRARMASGLLVNVYVLGHSRARGCRRIASGDWRAHKAEEATR